LPEPITIAAAAVLLRDGLWPEITGDLIAPRERLTQLRQKLRIATPNTNNDLHRALGEAFWLAILHVVAAEGEQAGASMTWPEKIGAAEPIRRSWNGLRRLFPSGNSELGLHQTATAEVARSIYPLLIDRITNPDSYSGNVNGIPAACDEIEKLFTRHTSVVSAK
jgi:hypothetical protein